MVITNGEQVSAAGRTIAEYLTEKGYELTDVYNYAYASDPNTWDVLATSKQADSRAIINAYDGLYEYDEENRLIKRTLVRLGLIE